MAILTGTLGADTIDGNLEADQILALSGDDIVHGLNGADLIDGGSGNDILYAASRGSWRDGDVDTVLGGSGDDTIYGAGGDLLDGGIGFDRLSLDLSGLDEAAELDFRPMTLGVEGGLGDLLQLELVLGETRIANFEAVERLIATQYDDVLRFGNAGQVAVRVDAGAGDDSVRLGNGDDRVFGEAGDDVLQGLGGSDRVDGGEGADVLIGGRGTDMLIGGAGADRFLFGAGDIGRSAARADTILDFSSAEGDRIDLSRIDAVAGSLDTNERFSFIGASKFSGEAGELRVFQRDGATFVMGDTDGDMRGDLLIRLEGQIDLTVSDFRL